jgi:acyl-coenzyme A thioesterase PaaI-like protein
MTGSPAVRTHLALDRRLSGEPVEVGEGSATAALVTLPEMAADDQGLVHGGFVFSLADHAAMLAVNHPLVVLASAEVRFTRPVRVGERLVAKALLAESSGRRRRVEVEVSRDGEAVFSGTFHCAVPDRHVLANSSQRGEVS